MGLLENIKFWKCNLEMKTDKPVLGESFEHMSNCLSVAVSVLPRLCLLGDQSEVPNLSKYKRSVLKGGHSC